MTGFFRPVGAGVDVFVRLTSRGGSDVIEGVEDRADGGAPEKGAANKALEKLLAGSLGLPCGQVAVKRGAMSRLKTLRVSGDSDEIVRKLEELRNAC